MIGKIALVLLCLAGQAGAQQPKLKIEPRPDLGVNISLKGRQVFPKSDLWNRDISRDPVDPRSSVYIKSIGANKPLHPDFGTVWNGAPSGIPYVVVSGTQPKIKIPFEYADESDPGPYPLPANPPIEGGGKNEGDRHVLMIDRDHWILYELFAVEKTPNGWKAGSGAIARQYRSPEGLDFRRCRQTADLSGLGAL